MRTNRIGLLALALWQPRLLAAGCEDEFGLGRTGPSQRWGQDWTGNGSFDPIRDGSGGTDGLVDFGKVGSTSALPRDPVEERPPRRRGPLCGRTSDWRAPARTSSWILQPRTT